MKQRHWWIGASSNIGELARSVVAVIDILFAVAVRITVARFRIGRVINFSVETCKIYILSVDVATPQ